jgi:hypothetical protein
MRNDKLVTRARHQRLRALGKCTTHPSESVIPGRATCTRCKNRRTSLRTAGMCPNHPLRPAAKPRTVCAECVERQSSRSRNERAHRRARGECIFHGGVTAVTGKTLCQHCLWKSAEKSLRRQYGITVEEYAWMTHAQNRGCALCGEQNPHGKDLAVDHCHVTGKVRALLCDKHNQALGMVGDNPDLLDKLAAYIRRYKP